VSARARRGRIRPRVRRPELPIRAWQRDWPFGIHRRTGDVVPLEDYLDPAIPTLELLDLAPSEWASLTLERLRRQRTYDVYHAGVGRLSRDRALAEVERYTPLGKKLVELERRHLLRILERQRLPPGRAQPAPRRPARLPRLVSLGPAVEVLSIDSASDEGLAKARDYRQANLFPVLQQSGYELVVRDDDSALRKYVKDDAIAPGLRFITGVGHGLYDTFYGENLDVIFSTGAYKPAEVQGKIVHLFSCRTARDLGRDMVQNGCTAYFGYDETFQFLDDEDALRFLECDTEIDLSLAHGLTAGETASRCRALFEYHVAALDQLGHEYQASMLRDNLSCLRSPASGPQWGAIDARLGG